MAEDPFFVGVPRAVSLRRELLMSSKDILTSLKRHEVLKEIRKAKVEAFFELRTVMEELMVLNRKLRGALPKTSMKPALKRPSEKMPPRPMDMPKKTEPKKPDQLDVLQDAMSRIEQQLRDLE